MQRAYKVGMYESDKANTIELATDDGDIIHSGIYVNKAEDVALFDAGKRVEILYFIEDLKTTDAVTGRHKTYDFVYEVQVEA